MGLNGNHRHASTGAATVPGGRERGTCRGRQDTCPAKAKTQRTIDKTSTLARKQHKAALILNKSLSLSLSLSLIRPL